jgi:hypothetical protein
VVRRPGAGIQTTTPTDTFRQAADVSEAMEPPSSHTLAAGLLVLLVLTAGCAFPGVEPESRAGAYDYSFGLDAYDTLSNATVRVPLPAEDGVSVLNASVLVPNGTVDGAFEARLVDTRYGPMLELRTGEFVVEPRYFATVEEDGLGRRVEINESEYDPEDPDHSKVEFRSVDVVVTVAAAYPVDTETPVGDEPLLPAASDRVGTACRYATTDGASCFVYDAPVYLEYDAAGGTRVDATVAFEGHNEWFEGGWTGNSYRDTIDVRASGPQSGWVTGDGHLVVGNGNYPTPQAVDRRAAEGLFDRSP